MCLIVWHGFLLRLCYIADIKIHMAIGIHLGCVVFLLTQPIVRHREEWWHDMGRAMVQNVVCILQGICSFHVSCCFPWCTPYIKCSLNSPAKKTLLDFSTAHLKTYPWCSLKDCFCVGGAAWGGRKKLEYAVMHMSDLILQKAAAFVVSTPNKSWLAAGTTCQNLNNLYIYFILWLRVE